MTKKTLINPNLKMIKTRFDSLYKITYQPVNCYIGDEVGVAQKSQSVCDFSCKILKLYNVNKCIYAYAENDELLEFNTVTGQIRIAVLSCGGQPLVQSVIKGGVRKTLIITQIGGLIDQERFIISYGNFSTEFMGRCFTASDYTITFCSPFDFDDYSYEQLSGTISVNVKDGKITGLIPLGENLFVFCENAIYKLSLNEDSVFKFVKLALTVGDILFDSPQCVGGQILFVDNGKICAFNGNSITSIEMQPKDLGAFSIGKTTVVNDKYLVELISDNGTIIYAYNVSNKSCQIFGHGLSCGATGGYLFDENGKVYKAFCADGEIIGEVKWCSKSIDFYSPYNKAITEVSLFVNDGKNLKIKGDFGQKEFGVKSGYFIFKLNCQSKVFTFEVDGGEAFCLSDLTIKYRIMGE